MADLKIIFEDTCFLVLEKETGLVVNRSQSAKGKTLQDQLADYFGLSKGDLGIGERAGIVHRLDKETSGLLVVAKQEDSYFSLTRQFKEREVEKSYLALVHGQPAEDSFTSVFPVGRHPKARLHFTILPYGRRARTDFKIWQRLKFKSEIFEEILRNFPKGRRKFLKNNAYYYSLLSAKPQTGRTHQIRVHLKSQKHPIVTDSLYAQKLYKFDLSFCPRLFLHASKLGFHHPETGKWMEFESPLPKDLEHPLSFLEDLGED